MKHYFLSAIAISSFLFLSLQSTGQDSTIDRLLKKYRFFVSQLANDCCLLERVKDVPEPGHKTYMNFKPNTLATGDGEKWHTLDWSYDSLMHGINWEQKAVKEKGYLTIERISSTELILKDTGQAYPMVMHLRRVE